MARTTVVEVNGGKYQLGRLAPDAGSFILMRLLGAGISGGSLSNDVQAPASDAVKAPTGDELVRAVVFAALIKGLEFKDLQFVQARCMAAVARLDDPKLPDKPMPLVSDDGRWTYLEVAEDIGLVMRLTVEVLVFNLADFFSGGGLGILMGSPSPKTMTP